MAPASWDELRQQAAREAAEAAEQASRKQAELDAQLAAGRDERRKEVELTLGGMRRACSDAYLRAKMTGHGLESRKTGKVKGLLFPRDVEEEFLSIPIVCGHDGYSGGDDYAYVRVFADGEIVVEGVPVQQAAEDWVERATPPRRFASWMSFVEGLAKAMR